MVNYWSYRFGSPQRGDVVVFKPPITIQGADYLIKRIVAIPGDTISINADDVFVNGKQLKEPYLEPLPADAQGVETVTGVVSGLKLQKDQYWVMGDNRRDSLDSRSFGIVTGRSIVGKAEVVGVAAERAALAADLFGYLRGCHALNGINGPCDAPGHGVAMVERRGR